MCCTYTFFSVCKQRIYTTQMLLIDYILHSGYRSVLCAGFYLLKLEQFLHLDRKNTSK